MYWTQPFLPVHACQTISLENSDLDHINTKLGKLSQMLVISFHSIFCIEYDEYVKIKELFGEDAAIIYGPRWIW